MFLDIVAKFIKYLYFRGFGFSFFAYLEILILSI